MRTVINERTRKSTNVSLGEVDYQSSSFYSTRSQPQPLM